MGKLTTVSREKRSAVIGKWAVAFQSAAGGPQSQDMLAAWVTWIASESGTYIYGNNPLNLTCSNGDGCYTGQIGWYQFPGNSRKFAAFESREAGARAIIALLDRVPERYGYAKILTAARKGDYVAFLTAIANSYWVNGSSGKPGYGGAKNLLSRWETWSGKKIDTTASAAGESYNVIQTAIRKYLKAHPEIDTSSEVTDAQFWEVVGNLPGMSPDSTEAQQVARNFVGKSWSEFLTGTATMDGPKDDPIASLLDILSRVTDPANWIRIFGLLIGAFMTYIGFRSLMEAAS